MTSPLQETLNAFLKNGCVPNILFYGESGSGKNTLVRWFVDQIYAGNKEHKQRYVMYVNCAYGKGIKFIRDVVKYFAKTNINLDGLFKTVVLGNADKLTCDAQSALRRCIEQFSFSTRFFIVTSERHRLLKPIISRFSEMYVSCRRNLHALPPDEPRKTAFRELMQDASDLNALTTRLCQAAYSAVDLATFVEEEDIDAKAKYCWLMHYAKIRSEYRNEQFILYTMLHAYVFRTDSPFKVFL
jgi:DNA polymerase III delta prime subunit